MAPTTTAAREWWTVRELAERWRVSMGVVYALLEAGDVKGKKIGGSWRVHHTALAAYESDAIPAPHREREAFRTGVRDALGRKAKSAT